MSGNYYRDVICTSPLFRDLCAINSACPDGNLLERTDESTASNQVNFLRCILDRVRPQVLVETGTNKGLFGLLASLLLSSAELHTMDVLPESAVAVGLLNARQQQLRCFFYLGDSRTTFSSLNVAAQFAWIDGGHGEDIVLHDLLNCYRLRIPWVAVDDTSYSAVADALQYVLECTEYELEPHPFVGGDRREARLLRLVGI